MGKVKCTVKLQYGSYSGEVVVYCDANDDNDYIIAKAWKQALPNGGFLSMASQSAKITNWEPLHDWDTD